MIGSSKIGLRPIRGGGGGAAPNPDPDAAAFIAKHNTESGLTMDVLQQGVVNTLFAMIKGSGTTNGTNFWASLLAGNSEVYPFCPVSDSVANAGGYSVDMIRPATTATFTNFVSGDFTPSGVQGGNSKYLAMKTAPNDFDQDSASVHAYVRTSGPTFRYPIGAGSSSTVGSLIRNLQGNIAFGINATYKNLINGWSVGLLSSNRINSSQVTCFVNGSVVSTQSSTSSAPVSYKTYGMALNNAGSTHDSFRGNVGMLAATHGFTAAENLDWFEIWDYWQTNIITGGRNV